jgi:hypothetical protein
MIKLANNSKKNLRFELWGSKVSAQAPNMTSLSRCTQCDGLGHQVQACPQYRVLGIHLLFKQPQSYAAMQTTLMQSGALIGYLGSSMDESMPGRRLTQLFDVDPTSDADMARIFDRLEPSLLFCNGMLHASPSIVRPSDRLRECRECGSLGRPHECPFASGYRSRGRACSRSLPLPRGPSFLPPVVWWDPPLRLLLPPSMTRCFFFELFASCIIFRVK